MYEKVNPAHPDKVADRIAGALVDYAYTRSDNPKIAVEVLIGHGSCHIIAETSEYIPLGFVRNTVSRIAGDLDVDYVEVPQDKHLAENQEGVIRCGDNGIFKGCPVTKEQRELSDIAHQIYDMYPTDGKYVINGDDLIVCQSRLDGELVLPRHFRHVVINPLGNWTGGTDVDTGATNRKLGSDMGDAVTGGGLHGKDLSKADVSVNIYAHILAQEKGEDVQFCCAIGDDSINGIPYEEIVNKARAYVDLIGGFEKLAEWGII